MSTVPVLFCIDVEPEGRLTVQRDDPDWPGVEELAAWCSQNRPRLEKATGKAAHFNWFLRFDPQVALAFGSATWAADRYRPLWDDLRGAGDELGLHVHVYRPDEAGGEWIIDHGDEAWVEHCVRSSIEAYHRAFGQSPRSYRAGDRSISNSTVALLERLGLRYELSGEPGQAPVAAAAEHERDYTTGMLPDYRLMPRAMYRPSRRDFLRPGRWFPRRLWMIPVSSGCVIGQVQRGIEDEPGPVSSLNLILAPEHFRHVMESMLRELARPYLGIVCRSGDWGDSAQRGNMEANLDYVLNHPRLPEFAFVRPDEAVVL